MKRLIILFFILISLTGFDKYNRVSQKGLRILFVGNSLTYTNDLPAMIKEIGELDGVTITYHSFLYPDYSLEDHWNDGKVKAEIEKNHYDFVVAQQGPSALPESQVLLMESARKLADLCNKHRTKLALYMVWPSKARAFDHDNVILSYTKAANATSSLLCPAGQAWKYAWEKDPGLPLYSPDNFHPSVTGSVLAALTIYAALIDKKRFDFISLDKCSWKKNISGEQLDVLKQAALRTLIK
ncbi:MAG: hypothetical protein JNK14_20790 [Chitinophagaceae bacterium]|nr:hypothetical protein [Chitinophagaceae bacterium]